MVSIEKITPAIAAPRGGVSENSSEASVFISSTSLPPSKVSDATHSASSGLFSSSGYLHAKARPERGLWAGDGRIFALRC
jgi:hypothetical protein